MKKTWRTNLKRLLAEYSAEQLLSHNFLIRLVTIIKDHDEYQSETNICLGKIQSIDNDRLIWLVYDKNDDALIIETPVDSTELGSTFSDEPDAKFIAISVITGCQPITCTYISDESLGLYDDTTDRLIVCVETPREIALLSKALGDLQIATKTKHH